MCVNIVATGGEGQAGRGAREVWEGGGPGRCGREVCVCVYTCVAMCVCLRGWVGG